MDDRLLNRLSGPRIQSRQIDELIGLARGVAADGKLNLAEAEFLQKWLAANADISDQPVVRVLYKRINEVLADGHLDDAEARDLLSTLNEFSNRDFELGEVLKATTLPLCDPAPDLTFEGQRYCFTGTFNFGARRACEDTITQRGGWAGSLTKETNVLVIGVYATDSWKHSSFGNKIIRACEMRDAGDPISIVSEGHWTRYI
jgi:NAD-dependent DNA ligase